MFGAALLVQIFLATSALAIHTPKERLGPRVARGASGFTFLSKFTEAIAGWANEFSNSPDVRTSEIWAGAVQDAHWNTFKSVTGTFTIPSIEIPSGSSDTHAVAPWVGIDGVTCESVFLYAGIQLIIHDVNSTADSALEMVGFCGWYPAGHLEFDDFTAHVGDSITLSVNATSPTSGAATIINHTTGKTVSHWFSDEHPLCQQDADWMVEDYRVGPDRLPIPLANWGTLTYTNASATTDCGTVSPSGATIVEMWQDDLVMAVATTDDSSVTIVYTGP